MAVRVVAVSPLQCALLYMSVISYQMLSVFFPGQVLATCNQMHVMNQRGELVGWPWLTSVFPSTRNLTLAFLPWVCSKIQRRRLATVSYLVILYPFRSFLKTFYTSMILDAHCSSCAFDFWPAVLLPWDVDRSVENIEHVETFESRISRCSRAQGSVSRSRMISWLLNCVELFLYHIASGYGNWLWDGVHSIQPLLARISMY